MSATPKLASLQLFPALARLAEQGKRLPFVSQLAADDCGAACLAMVLGYHGRHVELAEVRDAAGSGRGATAAVLAEVAGRYGLHCRIVRLDSGDLEYLGRASIVHWRFDHFVIVDRVTSRGVHILDPALGPRFIENEEFLGSFTGIALLFQPTASFARRAAGPSRVWSYLGDVWTQWRVLSRVVALSLLVQLFTLGAPLLTGIVVDRVVPSADRHLLAVIAAGLAVIATSYFFASLVRSHLLLELRSVLDSRMTLGLLDRLAALPFSFFQHRSMGDLMMRVNSVRQIRQMLETSTVSALLDGVLVSTYLVLLLAIDGTMCLVAAAFASFQLLVYVAARGRHGTLAAQNLEAQAAVQAALGQFLQGIATLKAAGAEQRSIQRWSDLYVDELNVSIRQTRFQALVEALNGVARFGAPLTILCIGAARVMAGELSLGMMLASNAVAVGFLTPLTAVLSNLLHLHEVGAYLRRMDDVFAAAPEYDGRRAVAPGWLRGGIEVEGVTHRFDPDQGPVLSGVSLAIGPGQSVAIVGPSGSGKSTLAHLLLGLFRPEAGSIRYDGQELKDLDLRALRQQIGMVPQDAYIFGGSIRANISLTLPDATLSQVVEAARLACLVEEVERLPMRYATPLPDGGTSLSGGQRQRLALARALIHRPRILILDEATSALDAVTEARVMANLDAAGCTRIVIAHRLSTIVNASQILMMERGRIVERGTHQELMDRRGAYARLVSAQTRKGAV